MCAASAPLQCRRAFSKQTKSRQGDESVWWPFASDCYWSSVSYACPMTTWRRRAARRNSEQMPMAVRLYATPGTLQASRPARLAFLALARATSRGSVTLVPADNINVLCREVCLQRDASVPARTRTCIYLACCATTQRSCASDGRTRVTTRVPRAKGEEGPRARPLRSVVPASPGRRTRSKAEEPRIPRVFPIATNNFYGGVGLF